jgi:hypothetical protein
MATHKTGFSEKVTRSQVASSLGAVRCATEDAWAKVDDLDDALMAYLDQGQDTDAPDDAFIGALWRLHRDIDGLSYSAKRLELLLPALDRWGRDIESLRLERHSKERNFQPWQADESGKS